MLQNKVGGGKPKMRWYFGEGPDLQLSSALHVPHTGLLTLVHGEA